MTSSDGTLGRPAGAADLRAAVKDAETGLTVLSGSPGPPPGEPLEGMAPGEWHDKADRFGLPPDCPVTPLGTSNGRYFFINPIGELRVVAEGSFGQSHVDSLFLGCHDFLAWAWPNKSTKSPERYRAEQVRRALMTACGLKGVWDEAERVRGRGAWRERDGSLTYHAGKVLWRAGRTELPGEYDGYVYQHCKPIPVPWPEPVAARDNPAAVLLPLLRTWNWVRPHIDPVLFLGWAAAGFLGGALPWRPSMFVIGDFSTGKSTLHDVLKGLYGDALVGAADATAAGVYQKIRQDSLPVALDELESAGDPRKTRAVLELARNAASGSVVLRGGDQHHGVEFNARSCFLFSSINPPKLEPEFISRMAVPMLRPLDTKAAPPDLHALDLEALGRKMLRLLLDNWHRFPQTLAAYQGELAEAGHSGRGRMTFGVLLACADMLIGETHDDLGVPMGEDLRPWRELLKADAMGELEDQIENWRRCLNHMLSVPVDAFARGAREVIGDILIRYWDGKLDFDDAQSKLNTAGLALRREGTMSDSWLIVPNANPTTLLLFDGTRWAGVWKEALRQAPEHMWKVCQTRINGVKSKGTMVALNALYGAGGIMEDIEG